MILEGTKVLVVNDSQFELFRCTGAMRFYETWGEWVMSGITGLVVVRKDDPVPTQPQSDTGGK